VETFEQGVAAASHALESGNARKVLDKLKRAYTKHAKPTA